MLTSYLNRMCKQTESLPIPPFVFFRNVTVACVFFRISVVVASLGQKQKETKTQAFHLLMHDKHRVKKSRPNT